MSIRQLLSIPMFWMMIFLMICAGSSESTMCQWASAITESALKVSKLVGDLAGPCLFAAFMGIARMLYGKMSNKLNLTKTMLWCGFFATVCYLLAALSSRAVLGLFGCALCGMLDVTFLYLGIGLILLSLYLQSRIKKEDVWVGNESALKRFIGSAPQRRNK
jgi:hypothetical protein